MDDIDRKILKILQDNARTSLKIIAEKTFLSSPAVSARIEKLEKDGIISGYHAMVDPMTSFRKTSPNSMLTPRRCPMCWSATVSRESIPCC